MWSRAERHDFQLDHIHSLHGDPDPDLVWMHDAHVAADMYTLRNN